MAKMKPGRRLVQCLGLFWNWDNICLGGGQGQCGMLLGYPRGGKRSDPIDFADQRGIYVLYANYQMIYVGQTGGQGLLRRLVQHRNDHLADRWDRFSWFGTRWVTKSGKLSALKDHAHPTILIVLNQIEALLTQAAEPALNRNSGTWGKGVKKYFQSRDERLGPSPEKMIKEIWDVKKNGKK